MEDKPNSELKANVENLPVAPVKSEEATTDDEKKLSEEEPVAIHSTYNFKDEPIKLILDNNGLLEITTEAINLLTGLKNEKLYILSLNGPMGTGKSSLANHIIDKKNIGFKIEKTEGIWIWGNPISLNNGSKLIILDCQGLSRSDKISHKLFMLSILLSTCIVYNTQGNLNEDNISDFIYFIDFATKINVQNKDKEESSNIEELKGYLPELIFINNILTKENMEELIEKNPLCENMCKLFEKRNYLNGKNLEEFINKIKNDIQFKTIQNNIMDGDSLFCLLQNYIEFINNDKVPVINLALENVLLSKAKNESEFIFEEFINVFNKKIEYPMPITAVYKIFFELQQKYTEIFCNKVDKILTPKQTGKYIKKMYTNMAVELETILEANKDSYEEKFYLVYKDFEEELNKLNLNSIEEIKLFILTYTSTFQTCLNKLLEITNKDFYQNLFNVISKIFKDLICVKLTKMSETLYDMYENSSKKYNNNIENLNITIKNISGQIDNSKKLLDDKNKEKNEVNKNFLELETKLERINRENKIKEKEYENSLSAEIANREKMETFYNNQIKEKEKSITALKSKIEQLNQENLNTNQESLNKINELNRENTKLQREIETMKNEKKKESSSDNNEQNLNLQILFKNIQNTFIGFKKSVDNLEKDNEDVYKSKSNSNKEIESKFKNCISDIKDVRTFCESQIKTMNENYKKEIQEVIDKCENLNFELIQNKLDLKDQTQIREKCEANLKEKEIQISQLEENLKAKDHSIKIQNDLIKMYEDKINNNKKRINELEISLCENMYGYKMTQDDFETLVSVAQSLITKNKDKYGKMIRKIPSETRHYINYLVLKYNFFSNA